MAKIRYFPKSGTTSDVGGMISTTKRKNTYKLVKMEMESRGLFRRIGLMVSPEGWSPS